MLIYNYEVRKLSYVRQEILEELIKIKKMKILTFAFIPSLHDIHQDHTTIAQGCKFKNTTLWDKELIWNNLTFNTQCFVSYKVSISKQKLMPQRIQITRNLMIIYLRIYLFFS